jgi:tol-pal system protein YbgF
MERSKIAFTVLVLASVCGCAVNRQEWDGLRQQVQNQQKLLSDYQKRQDDHAFRLEGIDNQLQMLQTRVEDNSSRIATLRAGQESSMAPVGGTLIPATLPGKGAADLPPPQEAPAPPPVAAPLPPAAAEAPPPVAVPLPPRLHVKPDDLYNSAKTRFEKGEYGQAVLEFEEYVANYGATELSDNAQYWIGECYYAQKDFHQAAREFDKVEKNFPKGNKVPAAKLKKGLSYRELGLKEEAVRELKDLVRLHPSSPEAQLAGEQIKLIK